MLRYGLAAMLGDSDLDVMLVSHIDASRPPDVVIIDASEMSTQQAESLQSRTPPGGAPLIVLVSTDILDVIADWRSPPHSILSNSSTKEEVVAAVDAALETSRRRQVETTVPVAPPATATGLSRRETQVLELIAVGRNNQEISDHLFLGVNTIKTYVRSAYDKIGVNSRTQAVIWAIDHGMGERSLAQGHASSDADDDAAGP